MRWYHYVSYFFGGVFLANAVPHFVSSVSGHPFQSPFAHPPGEGLSSALGTFELRRWRHVLVPGVGVLLMAVVLARGFGRFYGGL